MVAMVLLLATRVAFEDVVLSTVRKSALLVVGRRLGLPVGSISANLDIVPVGLIPVDHLFRTASATARVVLAPSRWLAGSDSSSTDIASDFAAKTFHVHVRSSTTIGNPAPGTDTPFLRAGR